MEENQRSVEYEREKKGWEKERSAQKKVLWSLAFVRIASFFLAIGSFVLAGMYTSLWALVGGAAIGCFLFFVVRHVKAKRQMRFIEEMIEGYTLELRLLQGDWSRDYNGSDLIDVTHPYMHDLDVLGVASIFSWLDRTSSTMGRRQLIKELGEGIPQSQHIARQETIQQLALLTPVLFGLNAEGRMHTIGEKQERSLLSFAKREERNFSSPIFRVLMIATPIFGMIFLALKIMGQLSDLAFGASLLVPLIIVGTRLKQIQGHYNRLSNLSEAMASLAKMVHSFSKLEVTGPEWESLKSKLDSASHGLGSLAKLLVQFDYRNNFIVAILLNIYLVWDIRCVYKLEKWLDEYGARVPAWLEAVGQLETLSSLAIMKYNAQDKSCWPQKSTKDTLVAEGLLHPVLLSKEGVTQTFTQQNTQKVAIVTGANMAGKSTFLRAVGVNWILASMGAPVLAQRFEWSGIPLFSSMRTADSLTQGSSYFHAELSRLQQLIAFLDDRGQCLIILDEILKGTNSKDKAEGSAAFVRQLIKRNAQTIVATHDLSLCELEKEYPNEVRNWYFDVTIANDDLAFDYTIREGVCQNMNAAFLMKKMGITH